MTTESSPPPAAPGPETPCDPSHGVILVRVQESSQLFNSLDPSPFLERDLDDDLVDYITSWAREIPKHRPLRLRIQVRQPPRRDDEVGILRQAIHNHFTNSAQLKRNEFRQLMRRGRLSLLIGLAVLSTAMLASQLVETAGGEPLLKLLREGVLIGGWVAMWRPLEILLYDWWPVRAERQLHERLRDAEIEVAFG
jgi:hypothetical protein